MLPAVPLVFAVSDAFVTTFGLLAFLLGMGVIANALIVFIVVRALGERVENESDRRAASLRPRR
jgi:hypothetical protein